jgi:hypothetical protein
LLPELVIVDDEIQRDFVAKNAMQKAFGKLV